MSNKKNDVLRLFGILLLWITAAGFTTSAQTVTGTITGDDDLPVVGASVVVDNAKTGVSTDLDGNFSINAKIGQKLTISCVGYLSKTVKIEKPPGSISFLRPIQACSTTSS